jgi:iron complex transport system ATP-binding protein
MLEAEHLAFAIGRKTLLGEVSLALSLGELVAVIGPNGAGKSTLLRLLAGETRPGHGTVRLDGRPFGAWNRRALARRRAVLPQNSSLSFPFTVGEVVLLGRAPHNGGIEGPSDRAIAAHALEAVGVSALAGRAYPSLSGGERQRVHLARVLAQLMRAPGQFEPGCLLLDEPVTSLDPRHQHAALALAREFVSQGGGALAILHDVNLAARYADRVIVLAKGRMVAAGTPAEALSPAVLSPVFEMPFRQVADPAGGPPILLAA